MLQCTCSYNRKKKGAIQQYYTHGLVCSTSLEVHSDAFRSFRSCDCWETDYVYESMEVHSCTRREASCDSTFGKLTLYHDKINSTTSVLNANGDVDERA